MLALSSTLGGKANQTRAFEAGPFKNISLPGCDHLGSVAFPNKTISAAFYDFC